MVQTWKNEKVDKLKKQRTAAENWLLAKLEQMLTPGSRAVWACLAGHEKIKSVSTVVKAALVKHLND